MNSKLFLSLLFYTTAISADAFEPLKHLAGITPYFESPPTTPYDPAPPQGCNITRATYLVRHAAIVANDYDYETYIGPFVKKLANTTVDWSKAGNLSFLAKWKSPIKEDDIEQLTQVGVQEATNLGSDVKNRYHGFRNPPKVWSSTAERTTKSASSFIKGLSAGTSPQLVEVNEGKEEGADSLTPYSSCPAYSSSRGSEQSGIYQKIYTAPIIARFNAAAPAFNFTVDDIIGMQELCGYESVINGNVSTPGYAINADSPFCSLDLFTADEWLGFEYSNDLMYWHGIGYGNPISGTIGLPWAKAAANLLLQSNKPDQDLYVSFTHRELPPTVLVALGLFNNSAYTASSDVNTTMPSNEINPNREWISSRILPFLTNIAMERMECNSFNYTEGDYYRVLVNQSPAPLPGCADGPGLSCSGKGFTSYMQQRQNMFGGFSQKCGVKYSNSTDVLGIYGTQVDAVGNGTSTSSGAAASQTSAKGSAAGRTSTSVSMAAGLCLTMAYMLW
ncbi:phosphoglycerate mutase-like protein [Microthyrium microscopicum]|uniref:Phosphoglycerate mutase-like protein n=1 Tax=Microthyrium microscopicum TaxID=703497 RepID=A0A6A6ULU7_9PEZI|nr:phosphoglycerate mutase-like protein [Microthyrium microscopicum]